MIRFLAVCAAAYGAVHGYVYAVLRRAFLCRGAGSALFAMWAALMVALPVLSHVLERRGAMRAAIASSLVANVWLVTVLWLVTTGAAADAWNLTVRVATAAWPAAGARLLVPLRVPALCLACLWVPLMAWGRADAARARWTSLAAAAALIGLGLAVWGRTIAYEFVWDDQHFIVLNRALRSAAFVPAYFTDVGTMAGGEWAPQLAVFRPLRNVSYFLDFAAAGLDPRWWHAHNVALHLLNALLVYAVASRLLGHGGPSAMAAAVFLLHPAQSEVVAWVKCRDDLLAALFSLASFRVWLAWREAPLSAGRTGTLGLLYLLACLSKDQAVILPLLWFACAPPLRKGTAKAAAVFAATGAAYLVWRHVFLGRTAQTGYLAGGLLAQGATMIRAGAAYLGLLVCPWRLVADYSGMEPSRSLIEPRVLLSAILLLAVAALAFRARRRLPVVWLGAVWTVVSLVPVMNVVPMMQFMAERFLYLPMAGYALAVGGLFRAAESRRPRLAAALGVAFSLAAAAKSVERAAVWKDGSTLFTATVRDTPPWAVRPRDDLLAHYLNAGDFVRALPLARELLARAEAGDAPPRRAAGYRRHAGYSLLRLGRREEGLALIREAAAADPSYVQPLLDLGVTEGLAGRHALALEWFDRAARSDPSNGAAHQNRGVALEHLGRAGEAAQEFRRAIALGPPDAAPYRMLAAVLWRQGRIAEAANVYREALRIWPRDPECLRWLARCTPPAQLTLPMRRWIRCSRWPGARKGARTPCP